MSDYFEPMVVDLIGNLPYARSWPQRIAVSDEVLYDSPYLQLWAAQKGFHMTLANGHAQYRLVERLPSDLGWVCELVFLDEHPFAGSDGVFRERFGA